MKKKNIFLIIITIAAAFSLGAGTSILINKEKNTSNEKNGTYAIKNNTEDDVEDEIMENQKITSDNNLDNEQITNIIPSNETSTTIEKSNHSKLSLDDIKQLAIDKKGYEMKLQYSEEINNKIHYFFTDGYSSKNGIIINEDGDAFDFVTWNFQGILEEYSEVSSYDIEDSTSDVNQLSAEAYMVLSFYDECIQEFENISNRFDVLNDHNTLAKIVNNSSHLIDGGNALIKQNYISNAYSSGMYVLFGKINSLLEFSINDLTDPSVKTEIKNRINDIINLCNTNISYIN